MSDLKWNSFLKNLNTEDVSFSSLFKEVGQRAMVQEVLFFSADLKGQDSVKLNFIYTVALAACLKHSYPWLYSSFNHLPAPPFFPQLHTDTTYSSNAYFVKSLPWSNPQVTSRYWRIKLNCWISNPRSALYSFCGLGLAPNLFWCMLKGQTPTFEGDCRIKQNVVK